MQSSYKGTQQFPPAMHTQILECTQIELDIDKTILQHYVLHVKTSEVNILMVDCCLLDYIFLRCWCIRNNVAFNDF